MVSLFDKTTLLLFLTLLLSAIAKPLSAQEVTISGQVTNKGKPVPFASVFIPGTTQGTTTDDNGRYALSVQSKDSLILAVTCLSYKRETRKIPTGNRENIQLDFHISKSEMALDEVVISGTLQPMSKLESPVPIEVYTPKYFRSNPTPSMYESLQLVNGVRPQINCAVCNTGDIHINGLEGAYSMVLIDGMPIVSGLSTVYGLSGIPQSIIERVEIVKGPASTLYGSEAVGGIINVITKKPTNAPIASADIFTTTWGEVNTDASVKFNAGDKATVLTGINYFNYSQPKDVNNDNFTDVTLQDRISVFNKWNFNRKDDRLFSIAGRYVYEDRWGGEMQWTPEHRGGTDVYGESIFTSRWELLGTYQLPVKEHILFMFSANNHDQNSVYGNTSYIANQRIGFGQLVWNKRLGALHNLTAGSAFRYTYYDDNTTATLSDATGTNTNDPSETYLPGFFVQDDISWSDQHRLLLGMRYDYNNIHGHIATPRLNYKWRTKNHLNTVRLSAGSGYRVANVFTEDHAALTGARDVVFEEQLEPEKSWNANINYVRNIYTNNGLSLSADATAFYTYFNNKIIPDYETDPNKIIYDNLQGYAVSQGVAVNVNLRYDQLSATAGATLMDVYGVDQGIRQRQILTERLNGTWRLSYNIERIKLTIDYTGSVYGPMRLPLLGPSDPRPDLSPWWSLQNIQLTKGLGKRWEVYGGAKNILNWTPWKNMNEEMIARAHDPFDNQVQFDNEGQALSTPNNPYGLTFDPSYVYAPNQGIRGFFGVRYTFDK